MLVDPKSFGDVHFGLLMKVVRGCDEGGFIEHYEKGDFPKMRFGPAEEKVRETGNSLTETIISAAKAKLPEAIREFDIGNVVREKVNNYPAEKLEELVLSVAQEHLRKIELFGALFGFLIGIGQAIQFYFFAG